MYALCLYLYVCVSLSVCVWMLMSHAHTLRCCFGWLGQFCLLTVFTSSFSFCIFLFLLIVIRTLITPLGARFVLDSRYGTFFFLHFTSHSASERARASESKRELEKMAKIEMRKHRRRCCRHCSTTVEQLDGVRDLLTCARGLCFCCCCCCLSVSYVCVCVSACCAVRAALCTLSVYVCVCLSAEKRCSSRERERESATGFANLLQLN